jgi:hypothetical protein
LAHPLSGNFEVNLADARLWVLAAIDAGYAPVAPYLMTVGIHHEPEDREIGLELDLAIIGVCDLLWICGPVISNGVGQERDEAYQKGIQVTQYNSISDIEPWHE